MLRSTFSGFTTGILSLQANQRSIDVAGQNIANQQTEGYTRQRVDRSSISPVGASYSNMGGRNRAGLGVVMNGIIQIRDPLIDVQMRNQQSLVSESELKDEFLGEIGNVFDQLMNSELRTDFSNIVSSLQNMASPDSSIESSSPAMVRSSMQVLINTFHQKALELEHVEMGTENQLKDIMVSDVNTILKDITELNRSIKNTQALGGGALELIDERNLLIDQLSEYVPIEVENQTIRLGRDIEVNRLSIKLKGVTESVVDQEGNIIKDAEGDPIQKPVYLVDDVNKYAEFEYKKDEVSGKCDIVLAHFADRIDPKQVNKTDYWGNADVCLIDGTEKVKYSSGVDGSGYKEDVIGNKPGINDSGKFFAMKEILNNRGDSDFKGFGYYEDAMNAVVNQFASAFNNLNKYGTVISPPADIENFTAEEISDYKKALGMDESATDEAVKTAVKRKFIDGLHLAEDCEISDLKDALNKAKNNKDLFSTSDASSEFTAKNIEVSEEWLQDAGVFNKTHEEGVSSSYTNVLNMIECMNGGAFTYSKKYAGEEITLLQKGTFTEAFDEIQNVQAIAKRGENNIMKNRQAVMNQVENSKDSVSGVSMDEEVMEMMKYQKSYQVTARFMTTLDEMLDKLINGTGVVGR